MREVKVVEATEKQPEEDKAAEAAAKVAAEVKDLPWRCVPCWEDGKDCQLEDKAQSDPTGRLVCPDCGKSHWAKTGLPA